MQPRATSRVPSGTESALLCTPGSNAGSRWCRSPGSPGALACPPPLPTLLPVFQMPHAANDDEEGTREVGRPTVPSPSVLSHALL